MHRRAYLTALGTVTGLALAGCSGPSGDDQTGTETTDGDRTAGGVSTTASATTGTSPANGESEGTETGTERTSTAEPAVTTERPTTVQGGRTPSGQRYDRTRLTITDEDGTQLGVVRAWVADTEEKRFTGLSDTDSLPSGTGMVFTYEEESEHTYVMREMDFPLDIVFIGTDGRITGIESARAPGPGEDGNAIQRTGTGQYVLEVPRGWTARRNISAGDHVDIPLNGTPAR